MRHKAAPPSLKRRVAARIAPSCATVLALLWGIAAGPLLAQIADTPGQNAADPNSLAAPSSGGPQIRSISAYSAYYSNFVPSGSGFQAVSTNLPLDIGSGGSIVLGWAKLTPLSTFSLDYTASYIAYAQNSSLNALNHSFSLTASGKIARRWVLGFSARGYLSSLEESLFYPATPGNASSAPAANGSTLTGSPLVESPVTTLLYGERMLMSSAQVSLSYSYSRRLSVTFNGTGARSQHLQDQALGAGNVYVIPDTTSGNASVAISYSLSPRTQLGATMAASRVSSSLYDSYTTTSQANLGRTGRHWSGQIHGGAGIVEPVREVSIVVPTKPQPVFGANLGYKSRSHAFLASYDRTMVDSFGLGAATSSFVTAGWRWGGQRSSWWLDNGFSWQWFQGGALPNTSGWRATVALNRAVGRHFVWITQYAHLDYSGGLLATAYHVEQDAVRVSLAWTPHPAARR
jgi:hypothetical protein